jgi:hypothetical protein
VTTIREALRILGRDALSRGKRDLALVYARSVSRLDGDNVKYAFENYRKAAEAFAKRVNEGK